ncbi:MAG: hypothetical protein KGH57_01135 [Candidatus Micrarchaeota archaeon]|nr:hypothetical protein [Candidatus Micrarchaeota archaeon]
MAKRPARSSSNKRLDALLRAQRMNELLKIGGVQTQALLDSAGESRPTDETHVVELLESERYKRSEMSEGKTRKPKKPARKQARRQSKHIPRKRRR